VKNYKILQLSYPNHLQWIIVTGALSDLKCEGMGGWVGSTCFQNLVGK
jgi:hypothetical protein